METKYFVKSFENETLEAGFALIETLEEAMWELSKVRKMFSYLSFVPELYIVFSESFYFAGKHPKHGNIFSLKLNQEFKLLKVLA